MAGNTNQPKKALLDFSNLAPLRDEVDSLSGAWLLVRRSEQGDDQHRTTVSGQNFSVGRRSGSSLCLSHATVSGRHAELRVEDDHLFLEDVGSTTGTLVNGVRVRAMTQLKDGDVIHLSTVS